MSWRGLPKKNLPVVTRLPVHCHVLVTSIDNFGIRAMNLCIACLCIACQCIACLCIACQCIAYLCNTCLRIACLYIACLASASMGMACMVKTQSFVRYVQTLIQCVCGGGHTHTDWACLHQILKAAFALVWTWNEVSDSNVCHGTISTATTESSSTMYYI